MDCISFLTKLNDEYGIDDTMKSHEEILQDIGEIELVKVTGLKKAQDLI